MSKIEKMLSKMQQHPQGWKIEDLKVIAKRFGMTINQPGTSHVTFRIGSGKKLTVPAHKPIKPVYVKLFLEMVAELGGDDE